MQQKTGRPLQFEIIANMLDAMADRIFTHGLTGSD